MTESRLYRLYDHMRPSAAAMERLAALETAEHAPRRAPRRLALAAAVLAALLALGGIVYANDVFGVQDWIQRTYRRTGADRRSAEVFVQGGTLVVRQGLEVRSFSAIPHGCWSTYLKSSSRTAKRCCTLTTSASC